MKKKPNSSFLTLTRTQSRSLATWVFGLLLFIFFVCVFAFAPKELPVFKQRMMAVASALLSGLFAFFLTGEIGLELKPAKSRFGDFGIKASGGIAVFVLVLWWWLSPWAPVNVEIGKKIGALEEAFRAQNRQVAYLSEELQNLRRQTPSPEVRRLAAQIPADADAYALALKAMAETRLDDARTLLDQADKAGQPTNPVRLFLARGQLERFAGQYSKSSGWFQRALSLETKNPDILNEVSVALIYDGKFEEASQPLEQAVDLWSKRLGKENVDVGRGLNNLAALYQNLGRTPEAERLYLRAVSILEQRGGKEEPDLAACLSNLAGLYEGQLKYVEAGVLYEKALAIQEKALKPDDPRLAVTYNNLAELRQKQNQIDGTEFLYERAIAIQERSLSGDHLDLATTVNNLAGLYLKQGEPGKSEPLYQRALAIREKALGAAHPVVAESLNNLATLYLKEDKFDQAEPLMRQALAIFEKAGGAVESQIGRAHV